MRALAVVPILCLLSAGCDRRTAGVADVVTGTGPGEPETPLAKEEPVLITITDAAAEMLRTMAARILEDDAFYLCLAAERGSPAQIDYDGEPERGDGNRCGGFLRQDSPLRGRQRDFLEGEDRVHHDGVPPGVLRAAIPGDAHCRVARFSDVYRQLERGWGRKLEINGSWSYGYGGNLDGATGHAWLQHSAPGVRKAAAVAYSRSPLGKEELSRILPILNDPVPSNRMFGLFAIERILGRRIEQKEYVPWASPAERRQQIRKLMDH